MFIERNISRSSWRFKKITITFSFAIKMFFDNIEIKIFFIFILSRNILIVREIVIVFIYQLGI